MISGSSSSPPRRSHRAPKLVDRRLLDHRLPGHERGIGLRRARPPQGLVDRIPRCPQLCDVDRPHHRHPRAQRPLLERGKFKSIVELIDTQCRAFERTPTAYPNLSEEALRALRIPAAPGTAKATAGAARGSEKDRSRRGYCASSALISHQDVQPALAVNPAKASARNW